MAEVDRMLVNAGPGTHFELGEAEIQGRTQLVWKNVSRASSSSSSCRVLCLRARASS